MITIRKREERGHFNHGWLETSHTFSFADYYDPAQMGFRTLRVINEDRVQPGKGFGTHSHQDMEIITYVLEGAVEHKDSMGNVGVIKPGDVQRMSAGTGVTHSEYNPSQKELLHLLQIWILPEKKGLKPGYEQKTFSPEEKRGKLCLVASRDGRNGSVTIHQDVDLFCSLLEKGQTLDWSVPTGRHGWVQVIRGEMKINGQSLREGDGAAISDEKSLKMTASQASEFLLFDLG
ncbi:MAG: pirin family protein [Deltaproteobacteria bacterium]|nr:pirin family protein [Deltaproteobacteria bacterium]